MEVLRNLLLSFSSSNILFIHSFTYTHVKRISVFLPRLLSLFWCFICPRFGQWKPFWDNLCGCLICFHHFEVHAYFLGYDVPSFSHSSADTPDQVAFPPPSYSRPSSFCLDSDIPHQAVHHVWAPFLTPLGLQHPIPGCSPMWISSSPCSNSDTLCGYPSYLIRLQHPTPGCPPIQTPPLNPTQTQIPHTGLPSYMNAFLAPMPCTPSWAIHILYPTQVLMPCILPPHLTPVGSNTSCWAISPPKKDILLCRTPVDTYFGVLGLPITYLDCFHLTTFKLICSGRKRKQRGGGKGKD